MKKWGVGVRVFLSCLAAVWVALVAAPASAQVTYTYVTAASTPANIETQVTCVAPAVCAAYTPGDVITVSFTTAAPLATNLANADISLLVTGYTVSDGVQTIVHTDPQARLHDFRVTTNGAGAITSSNIDIYRWRGVVAAGAFIDNIFLSNNAPEAYINGVCAVVVNGLAAASPADSCSAGGYDSNRLRLVGMAPGPWVMSVGLPTVTSLAPAGGSVSGATSVVITGTNFVGVTGVTFGGVAAASYIVNSPTQITAVSPPGAALGAVDIVVTTGSGSNVNTPADDYSYTPAVVPTLSEWAMILLALILGAAAIVTLQRRRLAV